jgi:gluconate 5-dehydrogenase
MARHKRKGTWMGHPLFDISGRIALITGSSRGIGRALAAGLLQAGCTVVLNARDSGRLERTRADLAGQTNGTVHAVAFDATSPKAVADGVARAEQVAGPLDILVNNAGAPRRAPRRA